MKYRQRWSQESCLFPICRMEEKQAQHEMENRKSTKSLYLITAIILLAGLGSAILIYLTAENASDSVLVHQFENSKKYRHDLELIGGKANVLTDELCRWFEGLWHGKSLAFTVACINIFVSFGVFFVAYHLPCDSKPDARGEDNRGGSNRTATSKGHNAASADELNTS